MVEGARDVALAREFEAYVAKRWRPMLRAAWLLTGGWAAAEDLAQTALAQVWTSWSTVRDAAEPDAYVHRMLTNQYLGQLRRRSSSEVARDELPEGAATDPSTLVDRRLVLLAALDELPPQQRAAVVLRYFQDLTLEQTAAALGCSIGTAKSQTSRALAKLRTAPRLDGILEETS